MPEVERNPPKIRTILLILGVLGVGLLIGWLAGQGDDPPRSEDDPVAASRADDTAEAATTTSLVEVAEGPDAWFTAACEGRTFEGDVLTFTARPHLYLAAYDEATEELTGCMLATEEPDRALELPAWSFDGRWAAWVDGDHVAVWDRNTGSLADVPHAAEHLVGAPKGFAYWDDDAEEIVEVDLSDTGSIVRTPVQATPDGWHCDRRESTTCLWVGLEAVVDTGDYIFMRRDPGGSMAGPIWLSRVTVEGDLWTYPSDFEFEDAELDFNILRDVRVDQERGELTVAAGFSCGTTCSLPKESLRSVDLEDGQPIVTALVLPDPPHERVWLVQDLGTGYPGVVVLRHQPNGEWFGANAFPDSSSPELFLRDDDEWVPTGFVAHTADRAGSRLLAFADEYALYVFQGSSQIPTIDDLLIMRPGKVDSLEWAPPMG